MTSRPPLPASPELAHQPLVAAIRGVILQSDVGSWVGNALIRPAELLDQWWAGLFDDRNGPPLAMHAGLHVVMANGDEIVAEQINPGLREYFVDGLHWTPLAEFHERERPESGGWNLTVPMTCFRQIDQAEQERAVHRLNAIRGRPFIQEDCTAFLGRVFAGRRLFADSPLLKSIGIDLRSGEPALPLLRADADLSPEAKRRLRFDGLRRLPDPQASSGTISLRYGHHPAWLLLATTGIILLLVRLLRTDKR